MSELLLWGCHFIRELEGGRGDKTYKYLRGGRLPVLVGQCSGTQTAEPVVILTACFIFSCTWSAGNTDIKYLIQPELLLLTENQLSILRISNKKQGITLTKYCFSWENKAY